MVDRPDISALNSTQASAWGGETKRQAVIVTLATAVSPLLIAVVYALVAWLVPSGSSQEEGLALTLRILLTPVSLVAAYFAFRALWSHSYWETSPRGLLEVAVLRRRFLEWSEIEGFEAVRSWHQKVYLKLHGRHGVSWVYAEDGSAVALGASILQHKGWHRQQQDNHALQVILSFWDDVPQGTPREIDWSHPKPPSARKPYVLTAFAAAVMLALLAFTIVSHGFFQGIMVTIIFLCTAKLLLRPLFTTAHHVTVSEDSIAVKTARTEIGWSWAEVRLETSVWEQGLTLSHPNTKTTVVVPYGFEYPSSREVAFAVIRHLRDVGCAVPIPATLTEDHSQHSLKLE